MVYPTGSGKTRKSALFMKRLLEMGYITRVLAIVPRSSLRADVVNEYRNVFDAENRPSYDSTVLVMSRKEFVARVDSFTDDVYGVFIDEFHTLVSRSMNATHPSQPAAAASSPPPAAADDAAVVAVTDEEDDGYKHKARMAIKRLYTLTHCLFLCASATPFFTKFDRELRMCVSIFDDEAGASTASASEFFGKRMILPTPEFIESIYDVTIRIVGDESVGVPCITDIRQPIVVDDFPVTGCLCATAAAEGGCDNTDCYVRRLLNEVESHSDGKHFVVSYRYEVRDTILTSMNPQYIRKSHHTPMAKQGDASAASSPSSASVAEESEEPCNDKEELLKNLKRRLERVVAACSNDGLVVCKGGVGGGAAATGGGVTAASAPLPFDAAVALRQKILKRQRVFRSAYWYAQKTNRAIAHAMAPASELFKHHHSAHRNSSSSRSADEDEVAADVPFSTKRAVTVTATPSISQRTFQWQDMTVYFVLPDDPPALLIAVRDAFNANSCKCILVTNTFFCEGHTIRNVTHMHVIGAFPTYECGTMFQSIGRVCRIHSHDVPGSVVEVRLYDDGIKKLGVRIKKAVERENIIRNGIRQMIANVQQQDTTALQQHDQNELDRVDFSVLTMPPVATAAEPAAKRPCTVTSMSLVSHFTNCAYVSPDGCLRDYSLQEYQVASKLNTEQRHVHQLIKRGIDPAHSERIIGFVRDNNLAPGHVFLTVPASIADAAPTERVYLSSIRRHIVDGSAIVVIRVSDDGGDAAEATTSEGGETTTDEAAAPPAKSSKQLSIEQSRKEMKLRRELAMLRKYHSNHSSASTTAATTADDDKRPTQQYRSVMALNVSRKMTKGALLVNMPINSLYELYRSISAAAPNLIPSLDTLISLATGCGGGGGNGGNGTEEESKTDAVRFEIIGKLVLWARTTKVLFVLDTNANGSGGNQHHYHHHRHVK